MVHLIALMSTLLIGSLVMSASTIKPYERPRTSNNHVVYSPRNHLDKDHGNLVDQQGKAKDPIALNKMGRSRMVQGFGSSTTIKRSTSRKNTELPKKSIMNPTRKFTTKKPKVITTTRKPAPPTRKFTTGKPKENNGTTRKAQIPGCGVNVNRTHLRIVGGHEVKVNGKFPWMAAVLASTKNSRNPWEQFCGGVLISNRHILTASHCILDSDKGRYRKPSELMVRLGDNNINSSHVSPSRRDIAVSKIFMHEAYNGTTTANDIAILQLKEKIKNWSGMIRPICLPTEPFDLEGKKATVAGWGDLSEGSEFGGSEVMMEVDLPIIGMKQCQKAYSQGKLIRPITKEQICAAYHQGGKDTCQGDSGGPLMFRMDHTKPWTVIGVISWGYGCARKEKPGVYTRVESYYDWIQSKMYIE